MAMLLRCVGVVWPLEVRDVVAAALDQPAALEFGERADDSGRESSSNKLTTRHAARENFIRCLIHTFKIFAVLPKRHFDVRLRLALILSASCEGKKCSLVPLRGLDEEDKIRAARRKMFGSHPPQ